MIVIINQDMLILRNKFTGLKCSLLKSLCTNLCRLWTKASSIIQSSLSAATRIGGKLLGLNVIFPFPLGAGDELFVGRTPLTMQIIIFYWTKLI